MAQQPHEDRMEVLRHVRTREALAAELHYSPCELNLVQ
jgi:hypothetical protein